MTVADRGIAPLPVPPGAARRGIAHRLGGLARRALTLLPDPRRTPLTFGYLLVLLATTITQHVVAAGTLDRILAASSTNVHNLTHHPVVALLASGLWLPGREWLAYAVGFAAVLAPLERRLGAGRAAAIALVGHVGVSLLTEAGVAVGMAAGWLPASDAFRPDVGASYLLMTTAGAAIGLLPTAVRWPVLVTTAFFLVVPVVAAGDMTSIGHLLCLTTGVAGWRLLHRRGLGGTMWPGRRPWPPAR